MAEREKGIRSMEVALTERHLKYLLEDTIDAQTKWYYIGLHLDIPPPTLEAIGNDCKTSHEQYTKVLHKWLQGGDTPTMRKMIEALESKLVQEKNLATQLRSKYENKLTLRRAQAIEIARLQEQMRQQQRERESKEREMAELRRQLQSAQISPPAQPQKITAAVRRVSKPEDEEALYRAAKSGDVSAVRRLVAANVNVDCTPRGNHWTPLMSASFNGHVEVVRILIGSQAQLNTQDKDCRTALHLAAQEGKVDVVRLLTEAGAQLNIQDENGCTAFYIACEKGHVAVVQLLLQKHADVSICSKTGATPLYIASHNGHTDVVDTLIRAGVSVNQAWGDKHSDPLGIAAQKGHLDTVKRLVEGGANVNYQNKNGVTALYSASKYGHTDVVDYLIRAGASINLAATVNGLTPIDTARANGHSDTVRLLERRNK